MSTTQPWYLTLTKSELTAGKSTNDEALRELPASIRTKLQSAGVTTLNGLSDLGPVKVYLLLEHEYYKILQQLLTELAWPPAGTLKNARFWDNSLLSLFGKTSLKGVYQTKNSIYDELRSREISTADDLVALSEPEALEIGSDVAQAATRVQVEHSSHATPDMVSEFLILAAINYSNSLQRVEPYRTQFQEPSD